MKLNPRNLGIIYLEERNPIMSTEDRNKGSISEFHSKQLITLGKIEIIIGKYNRYTCTVVHKTVNYTQVVIFLTLYIKVWK